MTEEHEHDFKTRFVFDEICKRTIETDSCICGYAKNGRIHH